MNPILLLADSQIEIPVGWILGSIGGLCGVISALAGIMWAFMQSRLRLQDEIIKHLQDDVDRLSKGCLADGCLWKGR